LACILKLPTEKSKGVISFTNLEYFYQIKNIRHTKEIINKIKDNWIICYHPNWEDKKFQANCIFDAVICHKLQFNFTDKNCKIPIIDTASPRMAPFYFKIHENKTWDFFHVSRYEPRKNIEGFFKIIKSALKLRQNLNGILLISVELKELKKIRKLYNYYFTDRERENFELITLSYDLPFPLSKKILAHFYNASKVTLNTHLKEPGGRVVGYALAAGLPVVGFTDLTRMVPKELRKEPLFFTTDNQNELPNLLIKSINYVDLEYDKELHKKTSNKFSEIEQSVFLKNELVAKFNLDNDGWFLDNLDLRLSAHLLNIKSNNTHRQSVLNILHYLLYIKRNLSFLYSAYNNLAIEEIIVNQTYKVKINKPSYIKLLDYLIFRVNIYMHITRIKVMIRAMVPNSIVKIIKKYL
jgi:hypothetical protein